MPLILPGQAGIKYVSNLRSFAKKPLTADDLRRFSKTLYGKGLFLKMYAMVFNKMPVIHAYNENYDTDEKLQLQLKEIFSSNKFSLTEIGIKRLYDKFIYGPTIFNPVWQRSGA